MFDIKHVYALLSFNKCGKLSKLTSARISREKEAQIMNCKYCNEPLEEGVTQCPACGMENAQMQELVLEPTVEQEPKQEVISAQESDVQEPEKKKRDNQKKSAWNKVLIAVCSAVLLGVVTGAILYGLGILKFTPRENNITYKNSYTVSDRKALRKGDVVIAVAGGQELTNSELQIYYSLEVVDFISTYSDYLNYFGFDYTKPLDKQVYSAEKGTTWQHMFMENAINAWYTYAVLNQKAAVEGIQISAELQQTLDALPESLLKMAQENGFKTAQEMIQSDFGDACTTEAYLSYLKHYYIGMNYFGDLYDRYAPTDTEIADYFEKHQTTLAESGIKKDSGKYVDVRHILIKPEGDTKDGSGNSIYTDAEWDACYAKAKALLDQWLAGEATEETFGDLANKHSQDPGSNTSGGLYTQVAEGDMKAPFNDWIFDESRVKGDYGLVKTDVGYHIMYFVDSEDIWIREVRSTILSERIDKFIEEAKAQYPIQTTYKKIVLSEIPLG